MYAFSAIRWLYIVILSLINVVISLFMHQNFGWSSLSAKSNISLVLVIYCWIAVIFRVTGHLFHPTWWFPIRFTALSDEKNSQKSRQSLTKVVATFVLLSIFTTFCSPFPSRWSMLGVDWPFRRIARKIHNIDQENGGRGREVLQPFCQRLCRKRVGHFAAKMQKKFFFEKRGFSSPKLAKRNKKDMLAHEEMRVHASENPKNELVERT